jgi:hypothetical protein
VLDAADGIVVSGSADDEGRLAVEVTSYERETANYLKGVSDVLLVGLRDLEREHPDEVGVLLGEPVRMEGE